MHLFRLPRALRIALAAMLLACFAGAAAHGPPGVAIVLGERSSAHREVADVLRNALSRESAPPSIAVVDWQDAGSLPRNTGLVITVGARALDAVTRTESSVPVLATLLPRATFEHAAAREPRRFSAVFLDQPLARQLNLLRIALPEFRRLAVLVGPASVDEIPALTAASDERGMHLALAQVGDEEEIYPALQRTLPEADILFALPDPGIYNARTIPNILLTTYRYRVPALGFSPAYVKAGALLAVYSTPAQIAGQAADIARKVLEGQPLPAPQYPRNFDIAINAYVARSLGIRLEDEASLRARLRQLEHLP